MGDKNRYLKIGIGRYRYRIGRLFDVKLRKTVLCETIDNEDKALENLLKKSVRYCFRCKGAGFSIFELWHPGKQTFEYFDLEGCLCDGTGILCAWCGRSENACECGGEE